MASGESGVATTAGPRRDERVRRRGKARRVLVRPEMGALGGAIVAWAFFAIVAGNKGFLEGDGTIAYLEQAAQLAILAVPVALLMIAGEFDLSVGSMIGGAGMLLAISLTEYTTPVWLAVVMALAGGVVVGLVNGWVVVRTGLPSFIVTLATLFIVRGLTLVFTRNLTGRTQVGQVREAAGGDTFFVNLFGGHVGKWPVSVFWALGITLVATFVLLRTRFGNWIFGAGGDPVAARNVGVPVRRVKMVLFVCTALGAALLALIQVMDAGSADVLRGEGFELQAIAAAVIGGCLLTGGYGSAVGAGIGALLFGMVQQGIFFTDVNPDWFQAFVGVMVLGAVLVNRFIRIKAQEG
jgi:simple sugar transport system permease protein